MLSVSGVEVIGMVDTVLNTCRCSETKHEADKVTHSRRVFLLDRKVLVSLALAIVLHVNVVEPETREQKHHGIVLLVAHEHNVLLYVLAQ